MYHMEGKEKTQMNKKKEGQEKDQGDNKKKSEEETKEKEGNETRVEGQNGEVGGTLETNMEEKTHKIINEETEAQEKRKSDHSGNKKQKEQVIELRINKIQPYCSREEVEFLKEAVITNHTSQTHFTNPAAGYCYRCPRVTD